MCVTHIRTCVCVCAVCASKVCVCVCVCVVACVSLHASNNYVCNKTVCIFAAIQRELMVRSCRVFVRTYIHVYNV